MKSITLNFLHAFPLEDQIDHLLHHTGSALLRQHKEYIFNSHFAYGLANPAGAHNVSTIDSTNRCGSNGNLVRQRLRLMRVNSGFLIIYLCEFDAYRQELHYGTPNHGSALFISSINGALTRFGIPELYICIVPGFRHINLVYPLVGVDNFECHAFAGRLPTNTELKLVRARDGWYILLGVELSEGRKNPFLDVFKFILALCREEYCRLMSFDH